MYTPNTLVVYVDHSFVGSGLDEQHHLRTGTVIMMDGEPNSAKSVLQKITTDSSGYAERKALHSAVKETFSACNLFEKLGVRLEKPTLGLGDNKATISIMRHSSNSSRCRHFLLQYFYAKDLRDQGHLLIYKVQV